MKQIMVRPTFDAQYLKKIDMDNTANESDDDDDLNQLIHGIQLLDHVQVSPRRGPQDKSLRILQLTDMHLFPPEDKEWILGANKKNRVVNFQRDGYDQGNKKAIQLVKTLAESVKPDLVIFTGDIVDGRPFKKVQWRETFESVTRPLLESKPPIPWTFCPGNHDDDDSPWTRSDLLEIFTLPGCATPLCTSFNHTFTLGVGTDDQPSDPINSTRLWIFDSGGNHPTTRYDPFPKDAVDGYTLITKAIRAMPSSSESSESTSLPLPLPTPCDLAFFHIPLPEYNGVVPLVGSNNLFSALEKSGGIPTPWKWVPWLVRCMGKHRVAGSSTINSGAFQAMRDAGLTAMFVGHDHYSDFVASNGDGPYMCYGRVSSFAPPSNFEGDGGALPWKPGGRVVRVDVESSGTSVSGGVTLPSLRASTWIETENGVEKNSEIVLDGTHHDVIKSGERAKIGTWIIVVMLLMMAALWWI